MVSNLARGVGGGGQGDLTRVAGWRLVVGCMINESGLGVEMKGSGKKNRVVILIHKGNFGILFCNFFRTYSNCVFNISELCLFN